MTEYPHDPNMFVIWCKAFAIVAGFFLLALLTVLIYG